MVRRKQAALALPRTLVVLLLAAIVLVLGGEAWMLASTGRGAVLLARWGIARRDRAVALFADRIRAGLAAAGVPADSVREVGRPAGAAAVRGRVGVTSATSLLQINYAVSRRVEELGGTVLAGRETAAPGGATRLVLLLGFPRRPLHEVTVTRGRGTEEVEGRPAPRLALVLFGFGDDADAARKFFALSVPFAVAIVPGSRASGDLLRAAHEKDREVVLHLPLEPVNYPQLNPGPGTLLVTMKPDVVTGTVRRWLDQAGSVVGVANHMGSLATQDPALMGAVFRELRRRHLPFIHVQPTAGAVCKSLAGQLGVVYDEPGAVLDLEARQSSTKRLDERWSEALAYARRRGHAAVWVRATPRVREWLQRATRAQRLGEVELAPLSTVIRRPAAL